MAKVEFRAIQKKFGDQVIIPGLDLTIESGEFVAIVGPSGCGKSTLLRMLAGLETPTSGSIAIEDRIVNDVPPARRGVSMVFQSYALYPHMTVRENLIFPLKMAHVAREEIASRVKETAEILDLDSLLERKPAQLSGGQKQRVAMGRAMIRRPAVLLFDEPLSNLDAQLRTRVRSEIALLHRRFGSTVVYVTHDQVEAMTLADRIAVLERGRLEQSGRPLEIYESPATTFVASFIGTPAMNLLPIAALEAAARPSESRVATVGFRPERTRLQGGAGDVLLARGAVALVEPLGVHTHVHVRVAGNQMVIATLPAREAPPKLGAEASVFAGAGDLFRFDADGRSQR